MPPAKKPKLKPARVACHSAAPLAVARALLATLPLEILAEILLYTRSPPTVVAVSRTCSFLYRTLALNPAASFIWRGVRTTCRPLPLPDPGRCWRSEADYAAFVFGGGVCEVCQRTTRALYTSFAVQIRLCGSWHCQRKFFKESLIDVSANPLIQDRRSLWIPMVESDACFRHISPFALAPAWPHLRSAFVRETDWEKFQLDFAIYESAEQTRAKREADGSTSLTHEDEGGERVIERCNAAIQRFSAIMELSTALITWKDAYDKRYMSIKQENLTWTRNLAKLEGWDVEDLVASRTYGSLCARKNFLLEKIRPSDVLSIRPVIESEFVAMQMRRKRQKSEAAHKTKLAEVKKIYERMRCGTLEGSESLIIPPLSVFCTLPSVRVLKGSPDPNVIPHHGDSTSSNIEQSPLATSLIISDIQSWHVPVQTYLMRQLGYLDGWQSASTRALSPLGRVTARFFCQRCGEGKVGRAYQRQLCLDLKGVCSHICVVSQSKIGPHRQAPHDSETEGVVIGGGDAPAKGRKKKRGSKTLKWAVESFKEDVKAIRLIKAILSLKDYSEANPTTTSKLNAIGGVIRCKTCVGWITMDFDTAIGHAHRHESMEIELVDQSHVAFCEEANLTFTSSLLAFHRGTTKSLLERSHRASNLCRKANYGCKHCLSEVVVTGTTYFVKANGWRPMNFNGLRSHVKAKHGIQDIRDEDFACFSAVHEGVV